MTLFKEEYLPESQDIRGVENQPICLPKELITLWADHTEV
jgi:hypothetical protein